MISFEDMELKKKEIAGQLIKSNPEKFFIVITEYLEWMQEHYEEMDERATKYVDKVFDNFSGEIKEQIEKMPDSLLKRKYRRKYEISAGKHHSVVELLRALDYSMGRRLSP